MFSGSAQLFSAAALCIGAEILCHSRQNIICKLVLELLVGMGGLMVPPVFIIQKAIQRNHNHRLAAALFYHFVKHVKKINAIVAALGAWVIEALFKPESFISARNMHEKKHIILLVFIVIIGLVNIHGLDYDFLRA